MSAEPNRNGRPERRPLAGAIAARRRAELVGGLRGLARAEPSPRRVPVEPEQVERSAEEACDICGVGIPADHRHLLHLVERRIVCACEACWAMRSGEGDYRPTGSRILWLADLEVPDELWAGFRIPIGLAFFMLSSVTSCVVAMYPSPAGATESELHFESWNRMLEYNPVLSNLETDIEGLLVNRLSEPHQYAIAPIDRCYALTGLIKTRWEGISGGDGVAEAVAVFFEALKAEAVAA